ncbi:MAG: hypothetical protein IIX80_00805 [Clostridia bacterium]|jgi:hypothetical protein|nr:hypothetical protein [Clostridia bacterium]
MNNARISVRSYGVLPLDRSEILRYAGTPATSPELDCLLDACLAKSEALLRGRVCFSVLPLHRKEQILDLTFATTASASLGRALEGCDRILLFAATAGLEIDRFIFRTAKHSSAEALLLQAIGTAYVEAVCDRFCSEIAQELGEGGKGLRPRFSPGYGDLPLSLQREVFSYLDCPARIGLTLNETLLMSPSKSVTAIAGILKETN